MKTNKREVTQVKMLHYHVGMYEKTLNLKRK